MQLVGVVEKGAVENITWGNAVVESHHFSSQSREGWVVGFREGIWHFQAASSSLSSQFLPEDPRGLFSKVTKVGV